MPVAVLRFSTIALLLVTAIAQASAPFPPELVEFGPPSPQPLFAGGGPDAWDRDLRERGWIRRDGSRWSLWYTGSNPARDKVRRLGLATSADGLNWTRSSANPLVRDAWVEDVCVVRHAGWYRMFAEGEHDIAHLLVSCDGLRWRRCGPLEIRLAAGGPIPDGPRGTPAVWLERGVWHLYYERMDRGVWLATSRDGRVFTNVCDEPVLACGPEPYDLHAIAVDQIVRHAGRSYAFYHASPREDRAAWQTCLATSTDLVHWTKYAANPLLPVDPDAPKRSSATLVHDGDRYRLYTTHPDVRVRFGTWPFPSLERHSSRPRPAATIPEDIPPMKTPLHAPTARPFGTLPDGRSVSLYTLEVPGGWRAEITDYGAILVRMLVPGANGRPVDVVLGCDDLAGYLGTHPYFGATCGRVANRIAGGTFDLDGQTYTLAKNNGANHLHGGLVGFDKKLWKATPRLSDRGPAVDFEVVSPAGDEGYPGAVTARVTYTLTPDGELWVEMSATTDAPTIVNLVHHSYWNLAGEASGTIRGHELAVTADEYLPVDAGGIPTGQFAPVAGTPFDLRPERTPVATLGAAIDGLPPGADGKNPGGIDHNYIVRGWRPDGSLRSVAVLRDPASGRTLELLSDQPGIQVYTGNYLDGSVQGKGGIPYARQSAVCLETQKFPDSVHHRDWPTVRLDPGETYRHTMVHRFSVR